MKWTEDFDYVESFPFEWPISMAWTKFRIRIGAAICARFGHWDDVGGIGRWCRICWRLESDAGS